MSLLGPVPGSTVGETPQFVVPVSSLPDQGDALELNQPVKVSGCTCRGCTDYKKLEKTWNWNIICPGLEL